MSDQDNLFREVDEEIRREQIKVYWDKFGTYIIGVAVLIVVVVAGYQGWTYWHQTEADKAAKKLFEAQRLASEDKTDEASAVFKQLIDSGPEGYQILARFQLASAQAAAGKIKEASDILDKIAQDGDVDQIIKGYAKVQSAFLLVDTANFEDMEKRIGDLATPEGAWRHSARELLGLSAYKENKFDVAQKHYNAILADAQASSSLRERANMMLALISSSQTNR